MVMKIRAVIFDKDGTLVDFQQTWGNTTSAVLDALCDNDQALRRELAAAGGFDTESARIAPGSILVGGTTAEIAEIWATVLDRAPDREFLCHLEGLFRDNSLKFLKAYQGVHNTLRSLRRSGHLLAVATNDSIDTTRLHLDTLELADKFDLVFGCDSGWGAKPGPGMIEACASAWDLPACAMAMVGDSRHDLLAARAAGAMAVAVTTGPAGTDLGGLADYTISSLEELGSLLVAVNAGS